MTPTQRLSGFSSCSCHHPPHPPTHPHPTHTCTQTREYFIAADEEVWDYAPFAGEMCGGTLVNFTDNANKFVAPGPDRIGRKYIKARYVEYTDASFTQKKVRGKSLQPGLVVPFGLPPRTVRC